MNKLLAVAVLGVALLAVLVFPVDASAEEQSHKERCLSAVAFSYSTLDALWDQALISLPEAMATRGQLKGVEGQLAQKISSGQVDLVLSECIVFYEETLRAMLANEARHDPPECAAAYK